MRTYLSATVMQLEHLRDNGLIEVWETLAGLNYWMTSEWRALQQEDDEEVLEFALTQMALDECHQSQVDIFQTKDISPDFARVVLVVENPDLWVRTLSPSEAVALVSEDIQLKDIKAIFVGFSDDAADLLWFGSTEVDQAIEYANSR